MSHFKDGETESLLQNGESAPSSNVDVQSEAANVSASKSFLKQHLVEEVYFCAFPFSSPFVQFFKLFSFFGYHFHFGFGGNGWFRVCVEVCFLFTLMMMGEL